MLRRSDDARKARRAGAEAVSTCWACKRAQGLSGQKLCPCRVWPALEPRASLAECVRLADSARPGVSPRIELPLLSHRQIQPLVHSFATEISTRTCSCLPGTYPSLLTVHPPAKKLRCCTVPHHSCCSLITPATRPTMHDSGNDTRNGEKNNNVHPFEEVLCRHLRVPRSIPVRFPDRPSFTKRKE